MQVYLDNAATTALDPEVLKAMMPYLTEHYGNPSSTHSFGRKTKTAIEKARKEIAGYLNCTPGEICFTSGGTEADNMAITGSVENLGVTRIISSNIEHHAVMHTLDACAAKNVKIELLSITPEGKIDFEELRKVLADSSEKTLVSLMHANNEIGTIIDIKRVGEICKEFDAYFHSDTVQTMGHFKIDLKNLPVHFITGAAHKFHGPKGVGFLYINKSIHIEPLIHGGAQERNLRAGTENIYGIVGLAKAMEIAHSQMEDHQREISSLKEYMKEKLIENFPGVSFNGCPENSLYTVLNVSFPAAENGSMLLFLLDIDGVAASGGSACSSGSNLGSHVLSSLNVDPEKSSIRFSFSKYNTREEIDYVIEKLKTHVGAAMVK